jgi:uncharacterized protein GlcG (DUF336 family)
VGIAIVDDGANLLYLKRLDGAQIASTDVALGKARTAMCYKHPSRALGEAVNAGRCNRQTRPTRPDEQIQHAQANSSDLKRKLRLTFCVYQKAGSCI